MNDPGTALRPLRAINDVIASLRDGVLDGTGVRRAALQIADAVEMSLRRLLRDDSVAPTEVRLRALAPDELRADEVLAELRQRDRISIELAASVHELFEARKRLEQGASLGSEDAPLALRVVDRLESEVLRPLPTDTDLAATSTIPAGDVFTSPPPPVEELPDSPPLPWYRRRAWAAGALALLLLLGMALLTRSGSREDSQLEQGITLFRSGAYADAAAYFWRYAEANPENPTPHLYLARIHRRMRRYDLAAQALDRAIALAPNDADVQSELGLLLLDTGETEVAVERFRAALRLDPENAGSWIGLVRALRLSGRPDAADRVLGQAPEEVRELFRRRDPSVPAPRP